MTFTDYFFPAETGYDIFYDIDKLNSAICYSVDNLIGSLFKTHIIN